MTTKNKIEAVLFASGKFLEESAIAMFTGLKPKEVNEGLKSLKEDYVNRETALALFNDGTRWKVNVTEKYVPLVKKLVAETELERPLLETLAVIAYRSPILQSDVVKSRGEGAYQHVSELVDRGFITKEKSGRSFKITIAKKFFDYFDVEGDSDIREIFKNIKKPTPPTLGPLKVVEAASDEKHDKEKRAQSQLEIYTIKQDIEKDKDYLNTFDNKLKEVSNRVSTAEESIKEQKAAVKTDKEKEQENDEEQKDLDNPDDLVAYVDKKISEMTAPKKEE